MHQLTFARVQALAGIAAALCVGILPVNGRTQAAQAVSVLYAGSLVTPMEGPIKAALARDGIEFEGEPGGSKKLANFISAGVRAPDVFIAVDPSIIAGLGNRVASSTTFAQTAIGVAWSDRSAHAELFDRVASGVETLAHALQAPRLRIGRTDPKLDPKGVYTIEGMRVWLGDAGAREILGDDENAAQIFPEEELLARVETGEADVGFFYKTEAVARGYHFIPLPGKAAMAEKITYALAVMRDAPHPEAARNFARFMLYGQGREVLERAGLTYLTRADSR